MNQPTQPPAGPAVARPRRLSPTFVCALLALVFSLLALVVAVSPDANAAARRLLTGRDIRDGSIQSRDIANGANGVRGADLANGAVGTAKLADGAVTTGKLADRSISAAKLAADAFGSSDLLWPVSDCAAYTPDETARALVWSANGVYARSGMIACSIDSLPPNARITSVDALFSDQDAEENGLAILARYSEADNDNTALILGLGQAGTDGMGDQKVTIAPEGVYPRIGDGNRYLLEVFVGANVRLVNARVHYTLDDDPTPPAEPTRAAHEGAGSAGGANPIERPAR